MTTQPPPDHGQPWAPPPDHGQPWAPPPGHAQQWAPAGVAQPAWPPSAGPPAAPPHRPPAKAKGRGTAASAGILALATALIYGGYGLLSAVVMLQRAAAESYGFVVVAVAGLLAVAGAVLVFLERFAGVAVLLISCLLFVAGSLLLAFLPPERYTGTPDDPRMLFNLVGILPVLVIALLVLLPSTRRHLRGASAPHPGPADPRGWQPVGPPDPLGKAAAIGAAVSGFLMGVILVSILLDVGGQTAFMSIEGLLQLLAGLLAVVGGFVILGRKYAGGLLLAIGGGITLVFVLIALFRGGGGSLDFRGAIYLLSALGALVLPLLAPTRRYLTT